MPLAMENLQKRLKLAMSFNLSGTSEMVLKGDWPHPGFMGDFLPEKREVSKSGFQAHWQSSWFANNLDSKERGTSVLSSMNN